MDKIINFSEENDKNYNKKYNSNYNNLIDILYDFYSPYNINKYHNENFIEMLVFHSSGQKYFSFIQTEINTLIKLYFNKEINEENFILNLIQFKIIIEFYYKNNTNYIINDIMFIFIKIILNFINLKNPKYSIKYIILIINIFYKFNNTILLETINIFKDYEPEKNKIIEQLINNYISKKYNFELCYSNYPNITHIGILYNNTNFYNKHPEYKEVYYLNLLNYKKEEFYSEKNPKINFDFLFPSIYFTDIITFYIKDLNDLEYKNNIIDIYDKLNIDLTIIKEIYKSNENCKLEEKYYINIINELQNIIIRLNQNDNIKEYFDISIKDLINPEIEIYKKYIINKNLVFTPLNDIFIYLNNIYDNLKIYVNKTLPENSISLIIKRISLFIRYNMIKLLYSNIEPLYLINILYMLLLGLEILHIPMYLLYKNINVVKYHTFIIKNIFNYIKQNMKYPTYNAITNIIKFRDNYFELTKKLLINNFIYDEVQQTNDFEFEILKELNLENIKYLIINYNKEYGKNFFKEDKYFYNYENPKLNLELTNMFIDLFNNNSNILNISEPKIKDRIINIINTSSYPDFVGNRNYICEFLFSPKIDPYTTTHKYLTQYINTNNSILFSFDILFYDNDLNLNDIIFSLEEKEMYNIIEYLIDTNYYLNNLTFKDLYITLLTNSRLFKLKEYYIFEHLYLNKFEDFKSWLDNKSFNIYINNLLPTISSQQGGYKNDKYYYKYLKYKLKYENLKFKI